MLGDIPIAVKKNLGIALDLEAVETVTFKAYYSFLTPEYLLYAIVRTTEVEENLGIILDIEVVEAVTFPAYNSFLKPEYLLYVIGTYVRTEVVF